MQTVRCFFFVQTKVTQIVHLKKNFFHTIVYIWYILGFFFLHFSKAGTVHTLGTEACHTCIAFAFYSWLAGQA